MNSIQLYSGNGDRRIKPKKAPLVSLIRRASVGHLIYQLGQVNWQKISINIQKVDKFSQAMGISNPCIRRSDAAIILGISDLSVIALIRHGFVSTMLIGNKELIPLKDLYSVPWA